MAYNLPHSIPDRNKVELLLMTTPHPCEEQRSRQKDLQAEEYSRLESQVIRYSRFNVLRPYTIVVLMYVGRSCLGVEH